MGKEKTVGKTLCATLNLREPPTKFALYNNIQKKFTQTVWKNIIKKAVEKAVQEYDMIKELTVVVGIWQKKGYISNNEVMTLISIDTGCLIDEAVVSKLCTYKNKLKGELENKCKPNFIGTSGAIESFGVKEIWASVWW